MEPLTVVHTYKVECDDEGRVLQTSHKPKRYMLVWLTVTKAQKDTLKPVM